MKKVVGPSMVPPRSRELDVVGCAWLPRVIRVSDSDSGSLHGENIPQVGRMV